jgi:hypothetical protein
MDLGVTILDPSTRTFDFIRAHTSKENKFRVCLFFSSPSAAGIFDPALVLFIVKPIFLSPSQFREE